MAGLVDLNLLFLLVAFAVSVIVVYTVIFILRKAYFSLSPKETAFFGVLMFILGFLTTSYLAGNAELEFAGAILVFLIVVWWILRGLYRRHLSKQMEGQE